MRLSNIEKEALNKIQGEEQFGLWQFIHDYLGAPAGAYMLGKTWTELYNYIFMHLHLVSDADLVEYTDEAGD